MFLIPALHAQDGYEYDSYTPTDGKGGAVGVRERARPDFDPVGIRLGSYLFYPSIKTGVQYDDNIFASSTGEVSDTIYLIDPELVFKSEWSRHRLDFDFSLNHREYKDEDAESFTDYKGLASGTLDVSRDFKVDASFFAGLLNESRGAADSPTTATEPTEYSQIEGKLTMNKAFNRLSIQFGVAYLEYDYDDVKDSVGNVIDQDNRDGDIVTLVKRAAYEFSPGYKAFVYGEYNTRDFAGTTGLNRDSDGYRVLAGVDFEISRVLLGEVGLGYLSQDYSAASFEDIDGFSYRAGLVWHPTGLVTVKAGGERSVSETVVTGASGRLDTSANLSVDYELLRNVIISPSFSYLLSDFQGASREDTLITGGIQLDYMLNRHFHLGMTYEYTDRDSNEANSDYNRQKVGAHVKAQF